MRTAKKKPFFTHIWLILLKMSISVKFSFNCSVTFALGQENIVSDRRIKLFFVSNMRVEYLVLHNAIF